MTDSDLGTNSLSISRPVLSLAPMQDVTDWNFWKLISTYGGPDVYFTEYFRVTETSKLNKYILKSIVENPTGKPAIAQIIGNDVAAMVRTSRELQKHNILGVDLNLGCPAPVVYKKKAGGGLLRFPSEVRELIHALRDSISIQFSVKTRIGFDTPEVFDQLLEIFAGAHIDLLTVHGRTVKDLYRSSVNYDSIQKAVQYMPCPVWANGNIYSYQKAESVIQKTRAAGLMIGRGAIRNPWIFNQIRDYSHSVVPFIPSGRDVLEYIHNLAAAVTSPNEASHKRVQHLKKYMNFVGLGIEPQEEFLHRTRRAANLDEFFGICHEFLNHTNPMEMTPFAPESLPESDTLAGCHL